MCRVKNPKKVNDNDEEEEHNKTPYLSIAAVSVVQLLLAPLLLCYSVILTHLTLVEDVLSLKNGLWTAILFVSTSQISESWTESYCKYMDLIQEKKYKRNIILATILLFSELIVVPLINSPGSQIAIYGIFGGLFSAIISVNMKYLTMDKFKGRSKIFETLEKVFKPLSLFLFPYFWWFLIETYGVDSAQIILSSTVLNIIPATLLIQKTKDKKNGNLQKYQTLDKLSYEMMDLSTKSRPASQSSSSLEDETEDNVLEEQTAVVEIEEGNSDIHPIYERMISVNILPKIPEENESEEDDDINEITTKRLSKISAVLQGLNENIPKSVTLSVTNLFQPDEVIEENVDSEALDQNNENKQKARSCFSVSSNMKFELERKRRRLKEFFAEHFIKSFSRNFTTLYIYPAIISDSIVIILSTIFIVSTPYVALVKSHEFASEMAIADAIFLLVIIGFGWTFFLAGYHVLKQLSAFKIKILFIFGFFISATSIFVAQKFSNDNLTVSCLFFGFGHGIVSYTRSFVYAHFFGAKWRKGQSSLNISSALIVILIYSVIYFSELEINVLLIYAYWPYIFNAVLWIFSFILKEIVVQAKNIRRYNREQFPDYNF